MELKELSPVEGQSLTGVSRDGCVGCVDELTRLRSLPSAQQGFSGVEEGAQGVSAAPQHLWDGGFRAFPSPVTAGAPGGPCWPHGHGDTGFTPGGIERFRVPVPDMGIHEQPLPTAGQRGAASWEKDGFMGWNLNRGKKLPWLHTRRKHQPPIQGKGFNSQQQMLVKHGNKGSSSAPTQAQKTPKPTR